MNKKPELYLELILSNKEEEIDITLKSTFYIKEQLYAVLFHHRHPNEYTLMKINGYPYNVEFTDIDSDAEWVGAMEYYMKYEYK